MPSRYYVFKDGKVHELGIEQPRQVNAPYVQGDTLGRPLRHMVSGKMFDSKSELRRENDRTGCIEVGTERLSEKKHSTREIITEKLVLDRIEKAESILNDPSKYRARVEENHRRLERMEKLLNGR